MNLEDTRTTSDATESVNDPEVVYQRDDGETTTEAVVRALSSALDISETNLEPIYAAINPDALNSLFGPGKNATPPDGDGRVVFEYDTHRVRVESDGTVSVY